MKIVPTVVSVGAAVVDVIARTKRLPLLVGETTKGSSLSFLAGGKAANTAAQCALLGAQSVFIGRMGDDHFGVDIIGNKLKSLNVNLDHSMFVKNGKGTGASMVMVDETTGKNSILVIPNENENIQTIDTIKSLERIKYISAVALQLEIPLEVSLGVARYIKKRDKNILLGLNPSPIPEKENVIVNECLELSDVICMNEIEASQITQSEKVINSIDEAAKVCLDVSKALTKINPTRKQNKSLVVTLGDQGCMALCEKTSSMFHISPSNDKAISTVGAGDSFFGTLLVQMSKGSSLIDSCRVAVIASGMSVTAEGAIDSYKTTLDIENRIKMDGLPNYQNRF